MSNKAFFRKKGFMSEDKGKAMNGTDQSLLGLGTEFKGTINFNGPVRIDGIFEGEIAAKDTIFIGKGGNVKAMIRAKDAIIAGEVTGDIEASNMVEMLPSAVINGDLRTPKLVISEGAVLNGKCDMVNNIVDINNRKRLTVNG